MGMKGRQKTSFEIDDKKVAAAKEVFAKTLTDTVDAALAETVKLRQRQQMVELLLQPALDDPETMDGAWR
jgi:hypothetical protein